MLTSLVKLTTLKLNYGLINMTYPKQAPSIIQVSVTHPSPEFEVAVVGTGDVNLNPSIYASSFVDALNGYEFIAMRGAAFSFVADGRILVERSVDVIIDAYADVTHSSNNSTVGVVFCIERDGQRILSSRAVHAKLPSQSDIGNISGVGASVGELSLRRGDIVGVCFASDKSGDITIKTSSIVITGY